MEPSQSRLNKSQNLRIFVRREKTDVVTHAWNPSNQWAEQEDQHFQDSLGYIVSSKLA